MNSTNWAQKSLYFTALFIVLLFATYLSNTALVYIDMDSAIDSEIQIFWTNGSKPYTEEKSTVLPAKKGRHSYPFFLPKFTKASRLRIDPATEKTHLKLFSTTIFSSQYTPFRLNITNISNKNNIALLYPKNTHQDYIQAKVIGSDPYFEITPTLKRHNIPLYIFIITALYLVAKTFQKGTPVAITSGQLLFFLVLILTFQLAWQSQYNIHPDESAHAESIKYYQNYWDPPTVGDPRAQNAYQAPWAISRLDNVGISYFFSGKFMWLMQQTISDEVFNARAFNLLMLTGLFFWCKNRKLLFFLPLLCTPQIWYLFSYANRGGFALLISLLLAWQLAHRHSSLHSFLRSKKISDNWQSVLFPSLLLGILSIEQTNYFIFILFIAALLLWDLAFSIDQKKLFIYKCLIFICLGISLFIARYALDISINGFNKYGQQVAYAEKHADPAFKPSVAGTEQGYSGLRLRQKGIAFLELFKPDLNWHRVTFKSFTGFYGYYAQESPQWYYRCTLLLYTIILICILTGTIRANTLEAYSLTAIAFIFIMGGCLISILYSWLYDFQPQGRYIFPIIPISLVYFWRAYPLWKPEEKRVMLSCSLCLILLSLYSFGTVALNPY